MKFYRCEICGEEIDPNDRDAEYGKIRRCAHSGLYGVILGEKDVCGTCARIGKTLDFEQIAINAWREAAKREA